MARKGHWVTCLACPGICAGYAVISWLGVSRESPTYDEPPHAVTGWMMLYRGDYRFSLDVPPLWEKWVAMGMGGEALRADWNAPAYRVLGRPSSIPAYIRELLFHSPANDALRLIARGRAMCLLLSCICLLVVARWGWEIGGSGGAVVSALAFALDPMLLAHGALLKNDVAMAMCYVGCAFAIWRAGRRLTIGNALAIGAVAGAAVMTKLSGLLLGPVIVFLLMMRALASEPWMIGTRLVRSRWEKGVVASLVCMLALVMAWGIAWASHGFRYAASPAGTSIPWAYQAPLPPLALPGMASTTEDYSMMTRLVLWVQYHRLMPEAWTSGYWMSMALSQGRDSFLFGQYYKGARWYYFPLALLVKTPVTLQIAALLLLIMLLWRLARIRQISQASAWTAACLGVPAAIYAVAALTADLNIGLRHLLPMYPLFEVSLGWLAASGLQQTIRKRVLLTRLVVGAFSVGLAVESLSAFPHFISYFNAPAGGSMGGLLLLSDSNLDWGQDLPLLADWQRAHPGVKVQLIYFGSTDPAYYGLSQEPIPAVEPHVLAITAVRLQYLFREDPTVARTLARKAPFEVLGGTIYLYQF